MSIASVALSGMNAAQVGLQAAAGNIANMNTGGFVRQRVVQTAVPEGGVSASIATTDANAGSPEGDVIDAMSAKHAFLANLAVFRRTDRLLGSLLDAVG
jgi:flagellar hook protein FlgE